MIASDRLLLKVPLERDFERYFAIHADPETNLFNPNGAMNLETAKLTFSGILAHWKEHGFGTWCICEKTDPEFIIGFGGLDYRLYGNNKRLNLGYRFDKAYWGNGYATELAKKAIIFGLQELRMGEIFAIVRPNHLSSIKVLEKSDMKLIGELDDVPDGANSLIYSI